MPRGSSGTLAGSASAGERRQMERTSRPTIRRVGREPQRTCFGNAARQNAGAKILRLAETPPSLARRGRARPVGHGLGDQPVAAAALPPARWRTQRQAEAGVARTAHSWVVASLHRDPASRDSKTIAPWFSTPSIGKRADCPKFLGRDRQDIEAQRTHPGVQHRRGGYCPTQIARGVDDTEIRRLMRPVHQFAANGAGVADHEHRAGVAIARLQRL